MFVQNLAPFNSLIKDVEAAMEDEDLRKLVQKTSERYPSVIGQIATRGWN